jgi:hypothetical protein
MAAEKFGIRKKHDSMDAPQLRISPDRDIVTQLIALFRNRLCQLEVYVEDISLGVAFETISWIDVSIATPGKPSK